MRNIGLVLVAVAVPLAAGFCFAPTSIARDSATRPTGGAPATTQPEYTPYLLGMKFPITPTGVYFPFFDRQLRGVVLTDATGTRFLLRVPTDGDTDRRLSLETRDRHNEDGVVLLDAGGRAEALLLAALRDALGGDAVSYAAIWHDGLDWDEKQRFAHPLRHAEMERRLPGDEERTRQRDLLEARLIFANAESRLRRAAERAGRPLQGADGADWGKVRGELRHFYMDAAKAYGLLGKPAAKDDDE